MTKPKANRLAGNANGPLSGNRCADKRTEIIFYKLAESDAKKTPDDCSSGVNFSIQPTPT